MTASAATSPASRTDRGDIDIHHAAPPVPAPGMPGPTGTRRGILLVQQVAGQPRQMLALRRGRPDRPQPHNDPPHSVRQSRQQPLYLRRCPHPSNRQNRAQTSLDAGSRDTIAATDDDDPDTARHGGQRGDARRRPDPAVPTEPEPPPGDGHAVRHRGESERGGHGLVRALRGRDTQHHPPHRHRLRLLRAPTSAPAAPPARRAAADGTPRLPAMTARTAPGTS